MNTDGLIVFESAAEFASADNLQRATAARSDGRTVASGGGCTSGTHAAPLWPEPKSLAASDSSSSRPQQRLHGLFTSARGLIVSESAEYIYAGNLSATPATWLRPSPRRAAPSPEPKSLASSAAWSSWPQQRLHDKYRRPHRVSAH
mmetsp:Transcript_14013/g.37706  ORF Transcript_14013/g.37706 Transcript_14013/m.37706 type:complete len:146 (-) Transcript_14013:357-794(-)